MTSTPLGLAFLSLCALAALVVAANVAAYVVTPACRGAPHFDWTLGVHCK